MDDSLRQKVAIERATWAHREELRRAVHELVHVASDRVDVGLRVAKHAWLWILGALALGVTLGLRKHREVGE